MESNVDKFHSLPNVGRTGNEDKKLRSLSLSQLDKYPQYADFHHKPSPFSIRWIHGYNPKVGVINLNDNGSTIAFYTACNCGVLYNWTTRQMKILQGHRHILTCIAADSKGKWLVTADTGPENILTIWNSTDYFPHKTIFSPHGDTKLAKLAMSADAKYLMTLGYQTTAEIYWWIWSCGLDEPHTTLEVSIPKNGVLEMGFNPHNTTQFLLMTKEDIWLGISGKVFVMERGEWKETDKYELKIRLVGRKTNTDVGRFNCYTFVKGTSQVLVGTTNGAVLVYGYTIEYKENVNASNYENLKFVKVLKIQKNKINVIQSIDGVIVTGNDAGEIHFYDEQMKLIYWVHRFRTDCIKGLSFNISPRSYKILDPKCKKLCLCWEKVVAEIDPETGAVRQKLMKSELPSDATIGHKPFVVRDFIVCSYNEGIGFVDFVTEKLNLILDYKIAPALSLSVHPEKPFICVGYADGLVELINFVQHKLFVRLNLRERYKVVIPPKDDSIKCNFETIVPELSVTCLKYSPSGLHLACGLDTGELIFLDPITIDILTKTPFRDTSHAIQKMNYSCDSLTLALADASRTVCVYKYDCEQFVWNFIGKHRAHFKDVTAIFFTPVKNESGEYKLFSLGADRIMVEYDINASSDDYLEFTSLDRIDQSAVPLTGIVWSTPKDLDPDVYRTDLPLILIANDEFKYKILNYDTAMTLSTVLGPRYETPVSMIQRIVKTDNKEDEVKQEYLLFATKNVIGLQKMPLDGNPWKHAAILGHPVKILQINFREDSGTLFTIGAKDPCICQWSANYGAVDKATISGGGDLDPYYCLVEDGRPGWLFQEIRDLFYYIQILCQGTFSPAMRSVKDYIPIDSLPDMMRALGYFITEYEVENLIVEAKYKVFQRCASTEIDFEEFVKLYLNHRPAFGENFVKIRNAFRNFATLVSDNYVITREDFVDLLNSYGEHFSNDLTRYLLSILYGQSSQERAVMGESGFTFLPQEISFNELVTNILGIGDVEEMDEVQSAMESTSSQQTGSTVTSEDKNDG